MKTSLQSSASAKPALTQAARPITRELRSRDKNASKPAESSKQTPLSDKTNLASPGKSCSGFDPVTPEAFGGKCDGGETHKQNPSGRQQGSTRVGSTRPNRGINHKYDSETYLGMQGGPPLAEPKPFSLTCPTFDENQ